MSSLPLPRSPSTRELIQRIQSKPVIAVTTASSSIRLFDLEELTEVSCLQCPNFCSLRLELIPGDSDDINLTLAVTTSRTPYRVSLHNLEEFSIQFPVAHTGAIWGFSMVRNQGFDRVSLVSGDWGGRLACVWSMESGNELLRLEDAPQSIFQIRNEVTWDDLLIAGHGSTGVRQYDSRTFRLSHVFPSDHTDYILGLGTIPDVGLILTASNDRTFKCYSRRSRDCVSSTPITGFGKSLLYDKDCHLVYIGLQNGTIEVFDPRRLSGAVEAFQPSSSNIYSIRKVGHNLFANSSLYNGASVWTGGATGTSRKISNLLTEPENALRTTYCVRRIPELEEELLWELSLLEREDEEERIDFFMRLVEEEEYPICRTLFDSGGSGIVLLVSPPLFYHVDDLS